MQFHHERKWEWYHLGVGVLRRAVANGDSTGVGLQGAAHS